MVIAPWNVLAEATMTPPVRPSQVARLMGLSYPEVLPLRPSRWMAMRPAFTAGRVSQLGVAHISCRLSFSGLKTAMLGQVGPASVLRSLSPWLISPPVLSRWWWMCWCSAVSVLC